MKKNKIVITGSSGFIGKNLIKILLKKKFDITAISRTKGLHISNFKTLEKDITNSNVDYWGCLNDVDYIIHCAARAHIMSDSSNNPLEDYREINTRGTLNLAQQAIEAGVKRFIFISSIKVNGESTLIGEWFKSTDKPSPSDFYGQSKSEAEIQLLQLAKRSGLEVVIIRPPLVYGPGVKANFLSLLNLVSKGIPMPFGLIKNNKRSFVSIDNLIDLIITCIEHPNAKNNTFLVSDDNDLSTRELISHLSIAFKKLNYQLPIPESLFHLAGQLMGKTDVIDRLVGSLQLDISHTKKTLNWKPPQTVSEGLKRTVDSYLDNKSGIINDKDI